MSGTPAYMAPEQACAQPLREAADWYAVGVMLYEALAGELPFDGSALQILRQKVDGEPRPIAELEPDAPRELTDLCMALLRRDPAQRPGGAEILARLGASRPPIAQNSFAETTSLTDVQPIASHFVGRGESLEVLQRAWVDVESGQTVAVHVRGLSGAGKSALLEHFLNRVERSGPSLDGSDVLVLRSRCYEREAMPFKALDSIIDALVLDLAKRDDLSVGHLLPSDIQALAQLFPVLGRVHAVKKLLGTQRMQSQARTHRQRAEAALRELLGRLAKSRPLIVWVDDLHWGDLDSVAILRAWLEQRDAAGFLLLLSYRSDEVETSPALRALLAPSEPGGSRVAERHVEIGPLGGSEVRALCSERLGARALGHAALIDKIIDEAGGSPFLASQLASLAMERMRRGEGALHSLSIDDLVTQTRELLPQEATDTLAVLAVAGRPMPPKLVLRVAGVLHGGRAVLHALRNLNLVRTRDADTERLVEIYHDRIREHVYGQLSAPQLRTIHTELLRALEHSGRADADWLHGLALGAGDQPLALQYGLAAAERAHATLAFERAAELYVHCLELSVEGAAAERAKLWRKLGLVLGYAGRGVRAAEAFLEAARGVEDASEVLELRRMAAVHLVSSGRFEQGDALFEEVMTAAGIRAPRSEGKLVTAVMWERTRLAIRGWSFRRRSIEQVSPAVLARIDLLAVLRLATHSHDALRSALFATQSLRLALDAGEPTRIVRALCTAASLAADGTERGSARSSQLFARAEALANELGTSRERLEINVARAAANFFAGRLLEVVEPASDAERAFREQQHDMGDAGYFYKFAIQACRVGALSQLDWRRFREELGEVRREVHATENVHGTLMLALNEFLSDEIAGQPELSLGRLEAQRALLPTQRFTVLHILHMTAVVSAACSTGEHAPGFECLTANWAAFERSPLRRVWTLRLLAHAARARLFLNEYVRSRTEPALLHEAKKSARALKSHQRIRLLARIAYLEDDGARALALLEESASAYAVHGNEPEALRDRAAIGLITGGEQGAELARVAFDTLEQRFDCRDARRNTQAHFPELLGSL